MWQRGVKPKLMDCVAQSLELLKSRGVGVAINSTSMLRLGAIGDGSAGYRVVATLTGKQRLKTYFDVTPAARRPGHHPAHRLGVPEAAAAEVGDRADEDRRAPDGRRRQRRLAPLAFSRLSCRRARSARVSANP